MKLYTDMKRISEDYLKKVINEALEETVGEAGMPFKPVNAKPSAPKVGGMPFKPVNVKPATPQQAPTAQAPAAQAASDDATQDSGAEGSVDNKGVCRPGILTAKYEPFYETRDVNESNEQVLKIWITYINIQAIQRCVSYLNQNFGDIIFSPMPRDDKTCKIPKGLTGPDGKPIPSGFDQYWLKIIVRPGKLDEFKKAVPSIVDGLYQTLDSVFSSNKKRGFQGNGGKIAYDDTYKPKFAQYLLDVANKTASPEEMQQMDIKIAQTVRELLMHLKDPEVQKKLGMVRVIIGSPTRQQLRNFLQNKNLSDENGKMAGWLLSPNNAIRVLAQDPNATYVAQEHIWRQWGHEVIDPNQYILVNMPTSWKSHDANAFDKACKAFGFAGGANEYYYAKKTKTLDLSSEQKAALDHLSNLFNPDKTSFSFVKFYDIANTRVMAGAVSTFLPGANQQKGLSDNLKGEVNAAAGGGVNATDINMPDQSGQSDAPSTSTNPEEVELFRDALADVAQHITQTTPNGLGTSAERDIVVWAYHYANFLVNSQYSDMIDTTAELFKKGFAAAIAASVGITDDEAANYLSQALSSTGKDSKIDQLASKWHQEYVDLLVDVQKEMMRLAKKRPSGPSKKVAVEEGVLNEAGGFKILNFNQFKNILFGGNEAQYEVQNDGASAQAIKESFFSFLDKMEGHGRY